MRFFLYLIRWQLSTLILYPCVAFLPFGDVWNVIIANLVGGIIFYFFDKYIIFNRPTKIERRIRVLNEEWDQEEHSV